MAGVIHRKVRAKDGAGVSAMLGAAADPGSLANEVDDGGYTPLFWAIRADEPDLGIIRTLLDAGASVEYEKIHRTEAIPDATETFAEMGIEMPEGMFNTATEYRESLLQEAIKSGRVEVVRLLEEYGADLGFVDESGYTALIDGVYGSGERLPMVSFLLSRGLDVNPTTKYGETPLLVAYRLNRLECLRVLHAAGADAERAGWTPLIRAIALGDSEEAERLLTAGVDVCERDAVDRSPLELALVLGNLDLAQRLWDFGANEEPLDRHGILMDAAVGSGQPEAAAWLVAHGLDVNARSEYYGPALATAAEGGDLAMVQRLLALGADPNAPTHSFTILEEASTAEIVRELLDAGAHPSNLGGEQIRLLLSLTEADRDALAEITREEYLAGKKPVSTTANPEETTGPYRVAMIRCGWNAYRARRQFDDPATIACGVCGQQSDPAWCADRFGQSFTALPDGRQILIAGEHEDSYDPDFCIYNDVFVFEPSGEVRIFGYPYEVFPPTDFHSATLVGDQIYILGSLGYAGSRKGGMPVYRLDTKTYRIERISTAGRDPGRIFKHRSKLIQNHTIRVEGGTRITFPDGHESHDPNEEAFELDLRTMIWRSVT